MAGQGWLADLTTIPDAYWIWMKGITGETHPAELVVHEFKKTFSLTGAPISGSLSIAGDDYAEVHVNDTLVGSIGSITDVSEAASAQGALTTFDLLPHLVLGDNTIKIKGQNGPGEFGGCTDCTYAQQGAGVVFGGTILYSTAD